MRALLRYLAQGTLVAVPIAITVYVVVACPATSVTVLDVKSSELMSFIVSGGIAGLGSAAPGVAPRARLR